MHNLTNYYRKVQVKLLSHVRLLATPWTAAYQAPPSTGFFQARVLEWDAIVFSECCYLVVKSCLTLCDPVDCGLLASSVRGIFQARILEWVAISFSNA